MTAESNNPPPENPGHTTTLVIAGEDDTLSPGPGLLAKAMPNAQSMIVPGDHAGAKTTPAFINAVTAFLNQQA